MLAAVFCATEGGTTPSMPRGVFTILPSITAMRYADEAN